MGELPHRENPQGLPVLTVTSAVSQEETYHAIYAIAWEPMPSSRDDPRRGEQMPCLDSERWPAGFRKQQKKGVHLAVHFAIWENHRKTIGKWWFNGI